MVDFDYSLIPESIKRIKIDVGLSYNVPHAQNWLSREKDLFVLGFEPDPESVEIISKGNIQQKPGHGTPLSDENAKRFHLFPVALGNVESPSSLFFHIMTNDCGTSSLYYPTNPILGDVKKIVKVPVYKLSHFLEKFPWDRFPMIEFLKVDAQGADLDVLKGADNYLKDRVVYVTAEPESTSYKDCANNSEHNICEYMKSIGFERIQHPNTQDPTFVNSKYKDIASDIYIYQWG
jgi:FkbM family methyltransferase